MKKLINILPFIILIIAAYITFSDSWIAPDINRWQARIIGGNRYFPAFTMCLLALPPLLILFFITRFRNFRTPSGAGESGKDVSERL